MLTHIHTHTHTLTHSHTDTHPHTKTHRDRHIFKLSPNYQTITLAYSVLGLNENFRIQVL